MNEDIDPTKTAREWGEKVNQQEAPSIPLNNFLVRCLNGWSINVAVPFDIQTFFYRAKADGYIPSEKLFINFDTVVSIELVGTYKPEQNVLPFGQPPQIVHSESGPKP